MESRYNSLRDFLNGKEGERKLYFHYSATLRIFGEPLDFDEISTNTGVRPTTVHRKGEKTDPRAAGFARDMWSYTPPVDKTRPLCEHLDALWKSLKESKEYLLALKTRAEVDVFLGYRTNCDTAGIEIPHTSLSIFGELQLPLAISIIVT